MFTASEIIFETKQKNEAILNAVFKVFVIKYQPEHSCPMNRHVWKRSKYVQNVQRFKL